MQKRIDTFRRSLASTTSLVLLLALAAGGYAFLKTVSADDWHDGLPRQYKSKWLVSDRHRPLPPVVKPGATPADPPADAVVLFDGKDLSRWRKGDGPAKWKVESGYMEMNDTGSIRTVEEFGDCQVHLEFMAPSPPQGGDQARGNSGAFLMGRYEIQVLDSYENVTYADGSAASIYAQHPPYVNACRPPGEWQTYDIIWRRPRFKGGDVEEPARVTMLHNGVLVHHNREVYGPCTYRGLAKYSPHPDDLHFEIQDHGDKQHVRFRNIWVRRLDLSGKEE